MILSLALAAHLADACAPQVARETLLSVAYNESGFDTLAIADNKARRSYHPHSRLEAITLAKDLIAAGHNIDMGIGQVNSRTAPRLGLTVFSAFDACANMAAAGTLMAQSYRRVAPGASTQQALAAMLSMYNTGNSWRGFGNGYVGRVYRVAANIVPMLGRTARADVDPRTIDPVETSADAPSVTPRPSPAAVPAPPAEAPATPDWVAFGNPANVMVFGNKGGGPMLLNRKETSR